MNMKNVHGLVKTLSILIFLGLFFENNLLASPIVENNHQEVVKLIRERINKNYNIGIVVAVIDSKGVSFYDAGTVSTQPGAQKVNQETLFPIASITKVFTALLLAERVLKNEMSLNDPAQKYLDNLVRLPTYKNHEITLEDLATHTSGLPSRLGNFKNNDPYRTLTETDLYHFLNSYKLSRQPGTQYEYGDISIGLLGEIISHESNATYPKLIENEITKPLGMHHTKIIAAPNNQQVLIQGYTPADLPFQPYHFPILQSAGAIYSTAADLAKFIAANMGYLKTSLYPAMKLTHISRHSQGNPVKNFDFPGTEKLDIGLGWNIDRKHHLVWKNGNMPGFSSFIGFNTVTKRGVVVLTNTGNIIYTDNLAMHILNPKIGLLPLYQEKKIASANLDKYIGKYKVSDETYYTFKKEDNHLKVIHTTGTHVSPCFNIYPMADNKFFGKVDDAVFTFNVNHGRMNLILDEGGIRLRGQHERISN